MIHNQREILQIAAIRPFRSLKTPLLPCQFEVNDLKPVKQWIFGWPDRESCNSPVRLIAVAAGHRPDDPTLPVSNAAFFLSDGVCLMSYSEYMHKPNRQHLVSRRAAQKKKRVRELFRNGYSYRQIMRALGFKSPAAVTYYLKLNVAYKPNRQRLISRRSAQRKKRVRELFRKGHSYRQIMRALGFKSPGAVAYYLKLKVAKTK